MSLWIEVPAMHDRVAGNELLTFDDPHWSLDAAEWRSDSIVALTMRKYPGNHRPVQVVAVVDCLARTADVSGTSVALERLEHSLDSALTWI